MRSMNAFICFAALTASLTAWAAGKPAVTTQPAPQTTAAAEPQAVTLRVELVDGKKRWLPEKLDLKPGKIQITLQNSLAEPHGFAVTGVLKEPLIVPANGSSTVAVEIPGQGQYPVTCHLHPAHVGATIEVR